MHRLSPYSLSVRLLGARRAWCRMTITMIGVHPIVTKGRAFGVYALCMSVIMVQVIP